MPCRRRDRRGAAAAAVGAALAAAGREALAPAAAFAGPAARPAPVRGAHPRIAAASSGRESRVPAAKHPAPGSAEHQSGVQFIYWNKGRQAWRVQHKILNGPDKGRQKGSSFRPKDESPEEVDQARLAAVDELRRLEEEDRLGRARASSWDPAKHQSGVQHVSWDKTNQRWRIQYRVRNGQNKGTLKQPTFRPKDASQEELERARLAAVEALQRLQEEDGVLGPSSSGEPHAGRDHEAPAAFAGPAAEPAPLRRAHLRAVVASSGREARAPVARDHSPGSAKRQSGVTGISWDKTHQTWRVQHRIKNGPDKRRIKVRYSRPKDESPEKVEQARLAAVEKLRRLEEEDQIGRARVCTCSAAEHQSGVKYVGWDKSNMAWRVKYRMKKGLDKGTMKQLYFRATGESPKEVEQARLAAVEALRRLQEEDGALGPSSSGGPYAGRDREEAPAASAEEEQLAAFRERYPVDDSAFDLLAKQPVEVQLMVISNFCPPEEGLSDHSTLLAQAVQTITKAARRPRQVATFSTGCFWESQRLFDRVRGIVNTTVGYTGGSTTKKPTYESVQLGDGHSEAIRIEFDPELITYDALLTHFDSVRERTPAGLAFAEGAQYHTTTRQSGTTTQYHSAVWYHDEDQKKVAQARLRQGAVHLARMENWHDAEKHHQKFYQKGCSVQ